MITHSSRWVSSWKALPLQFVGMMAYGCPDSIAAHVPPRGVLDGRVSTISVCQSSEMWDACSFWRVYFIFTCGVKNPKDVLFTHPQYKFTRYLYRLTYSIACIEQFFFSFFFRVTFFFKLYHLKKIQSAFTFAQMDKACVYFLRKKNPTQIIN